MRPTFYTKDNNLFSLNTPLKIKELHFFPKYKKLDNSPCTVLE